ncbi:hypothetical protein [Psychromicrobium lacuslunae]|uniref:SGNH hydrolase-type esterase domain-containing protein n=1 Tax=Psychromicrobium lacuslunae TaxID=1618207 RepID=A0A0D4BZJ1_9MICC|nr:hypothetical protein [Psychromicrobium lacuslunae]AJT41511.1 hypothetical protein UM93_08270 [Psychromicrobium lacuslunae]
MTKNSVARTLALLAITATLSLPLAVPAQAAVPAGADWSVSLGDSYISGEGGRWAGNSSQASQVDALGASAYWDAGNAESIERCHRSGSAEIKITSNTLNLACSGAITSTSTSSKGYFKPGLDFYNDGKGNIGQALALQNFATSHKVKLVAVSIGGNDLNFADVVTSCVTNFLTSFSWVPKYCKDDSTVKANFTSANLATVAGKIAGALKNVGTAMSNAGYSATDYRIVLQNYPQPLPTSSNIAYSQSGYSRQSTYGCGFWDKDLDWAAQSALPAINATVQSGLNQSGLSNAKLLDVSGLFAGHTLCQSGTKKLNDSGLTDWQSAGAVDQSEWINEIRTVSTALSDYYIQESLHPNYWGQLALRNCLRQAYQAGTGGSCSYAGTGLTSIGEPKVTLH